MKQVQVALVDTDVFSLLYVMRGSKDPRLSAWRSALANRRVVISFQTRAEILGGARANAWGSKRMIQLREVLDLAPTIWADDDAVEAHSTLFSECRRVGHPLHQKQHSGDRWVAAAAIAKGVELLAGDKVYTAAPGVMLLDGSQA